MSGIVKALVSCIVVLFASVLSARVASGKVEGTLRVDLTAVKKVSPIEYGFHYEEIGMIGEGGLYAELVRNRGLEEANPAPGLKVVNGRYANVPAPDGRNKGVYIMDPLVGWEALAPGEKSLDLKRVASNPLNAQNPHSLQVQVKTSSTRREAGPAFQNTGFFGMNFKEGTVYRLSFFARSGGFQGALSVQLSDGKGGAVSQPFNVDKLAGTWKKYSATLEATRDVPKGTLLFRPSGEGTFQLDIVSLFPGDTWDEGKSVFRRDIMQNLADYAPDFIRFPGGCIVHGANVETFYYWKKTIGDIAQRPGAWSKWKPNYRSDGLGYHEFYELCEYLGSDAMFVVPTGMVCTGWVFQKDGQHQHPEVNVEEFIQNALDGIEYAIGPVTSRWGAERAKNGHPNPFPLKYVEIGNEDFGPVYYERYDRFYRAIKAKYPSLKLITNSRIGPQNPDKRVMIPEFKDPGTIEVFDEHYYYNVPWAVENFFKFDRYKRPGPDLFIGELGLSGPYPLGYLAEGIVLLAMERNADLNPLIADRPLMRNWEFIEGSSLDPLLLHTGNLSVKTFNFFVSKLFRDNKIDRLYESVWEPAGGKAGLTEETLFLSAGRDTGTGGITVKVINLTDRARDVSLRIGDESIEVGAEATILTARGDQANTPETPNAVAPKSENIELGLHGEYRFQPRSLTILRFGTKGD